MQDSEKRRLQTALHVLITKTARQSMDLKICSTVHNWSHGYLALSLENAQ